MTSTDLKVLVDLITPVMREYVTSQTGPLSAKLGAVEDVRLQASKSIEAVNEIAALRAEVAGLRAELADVRRLDVKGLVVSEVAAFPRPQDGRSVTVEELAPLVQREVAEAFRSVRTPENGQDGRSVTVDELRPLVDATVQQATKDLHSGTDGRPGADGAGFRDVLIDQEGRLVVTMTTGETKTVGRVVGTDGRHGTDGASVDMGEVTKQIAALMPPAVPGPAGPAGRDGRDGHLEGLRIEAVDERRVRFVFKDGTPVPGGEVDRGAVIYQGVYRADRTYTKGDVVTHAGSLWHANESTTDKPRDETGAWTLCVKRGMDGKNGAPGEPGTPGKDGRDAGTF